jgi:hypothetical protein
MESDDIRDRVIGLLTAAYTAHREDSTEASFLEIVEPLLSDMLVIHNALSVDSDDVAPVAETVGRNIAEQIGPIVTRIIAHFVSAFVVLGQEYEATGPDADVFQVLHDYALSAQSDD